MHYENPASLAIRSDLKLSTEKLYFWISQKTRQLVASKLIIVYGNTTVFLRILKLFYLNEVFSMVQENKSKDKKRC